MLIQVRDLSKVYQMGAEVVRALDGVSLDVDAGEFLSITGASGSGKSTFMHLLGCLDKPTSGTYHLNDRDVTQMSDKELARIRNREIGFVFQTFNLINRTPAIDNVAVPLVYGRETFTNKKAMDALERVQLGKRAKHKPSEMSGGERQRVAIARAIVNNPKVIFADEPTGNLDTRTGEQIMGIFHDLHKEGTTIILVTHEMSVAAQAKRLIRMVDGVVDTDTPITPSLRNEMLHSGMFGASVLTDSGVSGGTESGVSGVTDSGSTVAAEPGVS